VHSSESGLDGRALLMQAGRDGVVMFGSTPGADVRMDEHGWLVLTSEQGADFNMAAVLRTAPTSVLDAYIDEIERRGTGAVVIVDEQAPRLVDTALARGLSSVGAVPVMVWSESSLSSRDSPHAVRRGGESDVPGANAAMADAFSLDEGALRRVTPPSVLSAGTDLWVVDADGVVAGSCFFVRSGTHVGVYSMATRQAFQRRGIGRAILETAMGHYLDQGATTFTLEATEAGYPLYERVGFSTAAEPTGFVVGASKQFPGAGASRRPG
jgi:GNAT superfamily N-acetyltransferase